jgi:hypothetical protein
MFNDYQISNGRFAIIQKWGLRTHAVTVFSPKEMRKTRYAISGGLVKDPFGRKIDDFHQDKNDDYPFQSGAISVLHDVFKKLQVFLDNGKAFFKVSEPYL